MAVTIAANSTGPGSTQPRKFYAIGGRTLYEYPFTVTFDSSYPTSGEDISTAIANSPWSVLTTVKSITPSPFTAPGGTGGSTAGHVMTACADLVNKKLILVDNGTEVGSGVNCSLMTIECVARGFR